jgi:hypothetical protein
MKPLGTTGVRTRPTGSGAEGPAPTAGGRDAGMPGPRSGGGGSKPYADTTDTDSAGTETAGAGVTGGGADDTTATVTNPGPTS